jgi:hypothetical protein
MRTMKQPSQATSIHMYSCVRPVLLVLLGALGAACSDEPEPGILVFDRASYDFGLMRVGQTSAERIFTVRNAGPDALDGLDVRLEAASAFKLVGTTCVGWLAPSETCTVTVAFTPAQGGTVQGGLVVEAERADARAQLAGTGAVLVRVTNNIPGTTTVVSEPAGIECGLVCEALIAAPEIVLSVGEGGYPVWSGACEPTEGPSCVLSLQEDVSVDLLDFATGAQWIVNDVGLPSTLAIDAANSIIGAGGGSPLLFKMSPEGELLWQTDELGAGRAVVDSQGNIGFADYPNVVWKLDGDGAPQWSMLFSDAVLDEVVDIAFGPAGDLYLTGAEGVSPMLLKLGSGGNELWRITDSSMVNVSMTTLIVDRDDNVIVAGSGRLPPPDSSLVNFLRKYDGNGGVLWTVEDVGFTGFELAVDAAGNIFVADRLAGLSPGSYQLSKYTPDGDLAWSTGADDIGGLVQGLAVTDAGDVIAVGTRFDEAGGAVGVWAAKFGALDGTRRRPIQIRLQGDRQYGHAVAVDSDDNVLLSGGEAPSWLRKYDGAELDRPE